jgi:hypothetical protein
MKIEGTKLSSKARQLKVIKHPVSASARVFLICLSENHYLDGPTALKNVAQLSRVRYSDSLYTTNFRGLYEDKQTQ